MKGRRDLSQHVKAKNLAMPVEIYRDQLVSIAQEPLSRPGADNPWRRYSLRHLARYIVAYDRAHRKARGWL